MKTHAIHIVLLAVAAAATLATGGPDADGPYRQTERGKVQLKKGFRTAHEVKMGKRLKGTAKLHVMEFFGAKTISGQLDVENPTDKKVFIAYHLSFHDDAGKLLGCASQNMSFDPGEKTTVGGAVVRLPAAELGKVAAYQIAYYEDDREIGKR